MQSRRDQVDAQRYLLTRLSAALVRADPDTLDPLGRRDVRGLVGGTVLAALTLGVVAIWALVSGSGSTEWRKPNTLIIEKGTGSRFLLIDGELRPVPNIASARLLTGAVVNPQVVPASRLKHTPRGAPVGIASAPDLLPATAALNSGVWRICASGEPDIAAILDIGVSPASQPDRPGVREGVLVTADSSDGSETYLLWQGRRLRLARPWVADVLGFGDVRPTPVDPRWLEVVPAGPDLAPVRVDPGAPGWLVGGAPAKVGDLFTAAVTGGVTTHYILLPAGLAPLTPVQFALTRAETGDTPARELTPADLAAGPRTSMPAPWDGLPALPPVVRHLAADQAVCAESSGEAEPAALAVVTVSIPSVPGSVTTRGIAVRVAPGRGALLMEQPVPPDELRVDDLRGVLVDGSGTAYPLSGRAMQALGYDAHLAVASPWPLLTLLPTGPRLTTPAESASPTAASPHPTSPNSAAPNAAAPSTALLNAAPPPGGPSTS
ncbi:type VII secretion protein EccB [Frankia sp. CcI49]|uniref:type VII secretion protein EccB n=1 Tax=Frankia sp. CcI49 TaxID=1745382 RepID=UPI000976B4C1|nr:type VII secretion protein EccB [Frankia sp. CcI49]ONH62034.1 type VII secretion protein EccB [Frankia sp. CcI49]